MYVFLRERNPARHPDGEMPDYLHVCASYTFMGERLQEFQVLFHNDYFCQGPVHPDPETLAKIRAEYYFDKWGPMSSEEEQILRADKNEWAARWAKQFRELYKTKKIQAPMLLWVTRNWKDQLFLWWLLTTLDSWEDIDWENVWLVDSVSGHFEDEQRPMGDQDYWLPCHPDKSLERSFAENWYPIDEQFVESAKRMWDAFARGALDELDQLRHKEEIVRPVSSMVDYGLKFRLPGQVESGLFRLSPMDQFFLEDFSVERWLRPIDPYKNWLKKDEVAELHLMNCLADSLFVERLREWDTHSSTTPLIESSSIPEGPSRYNNIEYRLTKLGEDIVRNGFEDASLIPTYPFGGTTIYDPANRWCTVAEGNGYRVVKV
ncbi:hypothetical protein Pla110_09850 [Polystyrenella longa]|uniref:DUF1835 domain-containing protein n=1 Tax=Polystyrenella longa TaxID=2528007 RepID=A0A518CJ66_9PLAN|nr:DUF1835 domain-containing protein [Polystyrenella longa]QDU79279.1 hypothetical protein Pla110_09850 [Polystyrenella longa]